MSLSLFSFAIDINKDVSEVSPFHKYISGPSATAKIFDIPHSNKLR